MKNTYLYFILLIFWMYQQESLGQSDFLHTLNASGNNISESTNLSTYSIGQVFFSYIESSNLNAQEGVQQMLPYTVDNEDSDNPIETNNLSIDIVIYPNPTANFITLSVLGLDFDNELNSYQLYNYQGRLLANSSLLEKETHIDLTSLSASIYILQVYVEEKLWKTFKIIKE